MDNEVQPGLYTLIEAASLTGLSTEALRLRIRRGKLASERDNHGRIRVRLTSADLDEFGQRRSTLTDPRSTESDPDGTSTEAWLNVTDRLLDHLKDAQLAAAEARERAAKAEGEAAHLRGELMRFESMAQAVRSRADDAEAVLSRLRARGWWARLRNRPY